MRIEPFRLTEYTRYFPMPDYKGNQNEVGQDAPRYALTPLSSPLTLGELDELDEFILSNDGEEITTFPMMDGFLHAIAVGPTAVHPNVWLPKIVNPDGSVAATKSIEELNHIVGLVLRHFNAILGNVEFEPREVYPLWTTSTFRGREYEDAESWAFGFVQGMKLCWNDWQPMLNSPEGRASYRPIGLLGEDNFGPEQQELTKNPARREKLTRQIPDAVVAIHSFWLPLREAIPQRTVTRTQPKVGRNDPCPCGSGKKFKKCCGANITLH